MLQPSLSVPIPLWSSLVHVRSCVLILQMTMIIGNIKRLNKTTESRSVFNPFFFPFKLIWQFIPLQHFNDLIPYSCKHKSLHVCLEILWLLLHLEGIIITFSVVYLTC
ncbi:hypothetical protein MtrunA17_Chr3g0118551 [Medicago truncatula]|uniref:Transmembrane protein n=1 Tax=Medicago truncatula TaxID=3880 RepID=A0A396IWP5_MEDTR|nr:hypothetical protein MtrunA17_Chr3g0118551 [Medicago truncatula]